MSVVYRFAKTWDLVIMANKDDSVTYVFWGGVTEEIPNFSYRFVDECEPDYEVRFG